MKQEKKNEKVDPVPCTMASADEQWRLQITEGEPTNYFSAPVESPDTNLAMHWIHGMHTESRGSARYISLSPTDTPSMIAYHSACVAIVYDIQKRTQRFYEGHVYQILSLTVHPNGHTVATGDSSSIIHVWDAITMSLKVSIQVLGRYGIQILAFSPTGDRIASISRDLDHTLSLHDCATGSIIGSGKGFSSPNDVLGLAYASNGDEMVIVGKKKIRFFRGLNAVKRDLGATEGKITHMWKKRTYCCVAYAGNDAVVGCSDGTLYRFKGTTCVAVVQAHSPNEPILCMISKGGIVVTGSLYFNKHTYKHYFRHLLMLALALLLNHLS